ncbi:MAG: TraR/DksA C4-type zinc finger protein [Aquihabitans sp.]
MSDFSSDQPPASDDHPLAPAHELEVDLSSFLPEGSSLEDSEPASEPVDLAVLTQIEADLAAVDRALTALDDDSYGRCDACGELIEPDRLRADPVGRQCGRHLEPANP